MVDRLPCPRVLCARAVALLRSPVRQVCQPRVVRVPVGNAGARKLGGDESQVECRVCGDIARMLKGFEVTAMQMRHLSGGAEECAVGSEVGARVLQR